MKGVVQGVRPLVSPDLRARAYNFATAAPKLVCRASRKEHSGGRGQMDLASPFNIALNIQPVTAPVSPPLCARNTYRNFGNH